MNSHLECGASSPFFVVGRAHSIGSSEPPPTLPLGAAQGPGARPSLPGSTPKEGSIFTGGLCLKKPLYKKTLAF